MVITSHNSNLAKRASGFARASAGRGVFVLKSKAYSRIDAPSLPAGRQGSMLDSASEVARDPTDK